MVLGVVHGPEGAKGAERVVHESAAVAHGNSQGLKFRLEPAGADADDEASTRDNVDGGEFFGEEDWVAQRQHDDTAGDADALGASRDPGEGDCGVEEWSFGIDWEFGKHGIGENDVLSGPEGFESGGFRGLGDLNRRVGLAAGGVVEGEETDLHGGMIQAVVGGQSPVVRKSQIAEDAGKRRTPRRCAPRNDRVEVRRIPP